MNLFLVTAPATEPLTVAEVRRHLRIDSASQELAPGAPTVALADPAVAGNVDNGAHRYLVTFVTADGETEAGTASAAVAVADKTVNGKVAVSAIPLGGSAVTSRKLYRTIAAGSTYLLLATVADNTTTTYTDNIADASLGAGAPSTNSTLDPELNNMIGAARQAAEEYTQRAFITQTWDAKYDQFPDEMFRLPKPPAVSITSIKYIDTAGTQQTWAASNYRTSIPTGPHAEATRIERAWGIAWPSIREIIDAVEVRFVAGYGAASTVPLQLKQAMLLIIGAMYENREAAAVIERGSSAVEIPLGAKWLMDPFYAGEFN